MKSLNKTLTTAPSLSIQESADFLKVSAKTLRRWEARGILIPQRSEGGHRRYSFAQLEEFKHKLRKSKQKRKVLSQATAEILTSSTELTQLPVAAEAFTQEV